MNPRTYVLCYFLLSAFVGSEAAFASDCEKIISGSSELKQVKGFDPVKVLHKSGLDPSLLHFNIYHYRKRKGRPTQDFDMHVVYDGKLHARLFFDEMIRGHFRVYVPGGFFLGSKNGAKTLLFGKGVGSLAYLADAKIANQKTGGSVIASPSINGGAVYLWERLIQNGYAREFEYQGYSAPLIDSSVLSSEALEAAFEFFEESSTHYVGFSLRRLLAK